MTFHSILRHKRHLLRLACRVADLANSAVEWTAVSELVALQLRDAMSGIPVGVLSNGIDLAFWRETPSTAARGRGAPTLVSTMRLHGKKRPRQLLSAFAQAAARTTAPVRLLIVGEGPEREAIAADILALGLDRGDARAEMLGWLSPTSLRGVYAGADGFVLPTEREAFGIAALEAAAAGLPVIAMAEAGCREFLTDGGTALLCQDDAALANRIAQFIREPDLRASIANASGLERYDWSRVLAEHEARYRRAIVRAGGAAAAVPA